MKPARLTASALMGFDAELGQFFARIAPAIDHDDIRADPDIETPFECHPEQHEHRDGHTEGNRPRKYHPRKNDQHRKPPDLVFMVRSRILTCNVHMDFFQVHPVNRPVGFRLFNFLSEHCLLPSLIQADRTCP